MALGPFGGPFAGAIRIVAGAAQEQQIGASDQGVQVRLTSGIGRIGDVAGFTGVEGQEMRTGSTAGRVGPD
jgi:hypothetical protein